MLFRSAGEDQEDTSSLLPYPAPGPGEPLAAPSGLEQGMCAGRRAPGRRDSTGGLPPARHHHQGSLGTPTSGPGVPRCSDPCAALSGFGWAQGTRRRAHEPRDGAWSLPPAQRQPNVAAASTCVKSFTLGNHPSAEDVGKPENEITEASATDAPLLGPDKENPLLVTSVS